MTGMTPAIEVLSILMAVAFENLLVAAFISCVTLSKQNGVISYCPLRVFGRSDV